jgi:hypothetical protein
LSRNHQQLRFWILTGDALTLRFRAVIRQQVQQWNRPRWLLFTLLATTLSLIEEAVTVSMTNLAPVFGVQVGQA